jgi:phosphatidylglycerophosphate synthase
MAFVDAHPLRVLLPQSSRVRSPIAETSTAQGQKNWIRIMSTLQPDQPLTKSAPPSLALADARRVRVLLIDSGVDPRLRVARLGLVERWQQVLGDLDAEVRTLAPEDLSIALAEEAMTTPPRWILLTWADRVVEPSAVEAFFAQIPAGAVDGPPALRVAAIGLGDGPLLALSTAHAVALSRRLSVQAAGSADGVANALEAVMGQPPVLVPMRAAYWGRVTNQVEGKAAVWGLLRRLRWRQGGVVAHYVNRPVSIRISRLIAETAITPNQTTIFTFILGLLGVALVLTPGGYWGGVLGLLLLHVNSVFDGIDGELARLRHQSSAFGAYLDSVCDETLNSALMIAVGWDLSRRAMFGWNGWFVLGILSGAVSFLYALVHWHCKWKHGLGLYWWWDAYKPRKKLQASNSLRSYFMRLFQKDGLLFMFLLAALANGLPIMLILSTGAAIITLALLVVHIGIKRAPW